MPTFAVGVPGRRAAGVDSAPVFAQYQSLAFWRYPTQISTDTTLILSLLHTDGLSFSRVRAYHRLPPMQERSLSPYVPNSASFLSPLVSSYQAGGKAKAIRGSGSCSEGYRGERDFDHYDTAPGTERGG